MVEFAPSKKDVVEVFSSFAVCTDFLSRVFIDLPDESFISTLVSRNLFSEWPLPGKSEMSEGLKLMQQFCAGWAPERIAGLKDDYTRLFIGQETMLVPPYESVYTSRDKTVFTESTLDVRDYYREFSLQMSRLHREPDDHIGAELNFVSFLCREKARSHDEEDEDLEIRIDRAVKGFLTDHLINWVGLFLSSLLNQECSDFYRGGGYLVKGTVDMLYTTVTFSP